MESTLLIFICILLVITIVLIILFRSKANAENPQLDKKIIELQSAVSKIELGLKEDFKLNREENAGTAKDKAFKYI